MNFKVTPHVTSWECVSQGPHSKQRYTCYRKVYFGGTYSAAGARESTAHGCHLLEDAGRDLDIREPQLATLKKDWETNAVILLTFCPLPHAGHLIGLMQQRDQKTQDPIDGLPTGQHPGTESSIKQDMSGMGNKGGNVIRHMDISLCLNLLEELLVFCFFVYSLGIGKERFHIWLHFIVFIETASQHTANFHQSK